MTNNALEFTTAKRRRDPIPFSLDGEQFTFSPPKVASLVLPIIEGSGENDYIKARYDWLGEGLDNHDWSVLEAADRLRAWGEDPDAAAPEGYQAPDTSNYPNGWQGKQSLRILERLHDRNDDLEAGKLSDIIDALLEKIAGRPTT